MWFRLAIAISILLSSPFAAASGGYGGGGYGGSSSSSYTPPPVDERYEYGKALFKGRVRNIKSVKLCMDYKGKQKKMSKKTLKPYKGRNRDEVISKIYVCNSSDTAFTDVFQRSEQLDILYYFNKRYKLKFSK